MYEKQSAAIKLFSCCIATVSLLLLLFCLPSLIPGPYTYFPKDQEATAQASAAGTSCINYDPFAKLITVNCTSASLSDVYNQINDPTILRIEEQSSSNNVWLLNANLTISQGATLHINSTDAVWLKIVSDGTSAYNIDVH